MRKHLFLFALIILSLFLLLPSCLDKSSGAINTGAVKLKNPIIFGAELQMIALEQEVDSSVSNFVTQVDLISNKLVTSNANEIFAMKKTLDSSITLFKNFMDLSHEKGMY